jgi:hypothetical protein
MNQSHEASDPLEVPIEKRAVKLTAHKSSTFLNNSLANAYLRWFPTYQFTVLRLFNTR